jgi:hypothetical protein
MRLTRPVKLILKTTDLSAAGYALSVGSGGVAVSGVFCIRHQHAELDRLER